MANFVSVVKLWCVVWWLPAFRRILVPIFKWSRKKTRSMSKVSAVPFWKLC